jgi:molybdenum cofactor cytidylyltransferase
MPGRERTGTGMTPGEPADLSPWASALWPTGLPVAVAAIVPAAGRSERMGRPKLILPIGGMAVIARVVAALRQGGADPVVVVAAPADAPGGSVLADEAARLGARVVVPPGPTADMRASIELGLDALDGASPPGALLLAPGDSPGISPEAVARLIARFGADRPAIVVPTCAGRRGHPVLLRWDVALRIRRLPAGVGVNAVLAAGAEEVVALELGDPGTLADLDTPEDYRRWTTATY